LLAVVVCRGLFLVETGYRRLPIPVFWHPLIGALGFAVIGLFVPRALGTGYSSIEDVLSDRLAVTTLLALFLAKLLAWWLALGSSNSGSILAPILLISGAFGGLCGSLAEAVVPGTGVSAGAVALVAMAATLGATTGASLTAIAFAFELTRDYKAILPIMLATVLATLVAMLLLEHNLMTEKLARRGVGVPAAYEPDVLRTTPVAVGMASPAATILGDWTVSDARALIASGEHRAYPIVDENEGCVGIITENDLLAHTEAKDADPVLTIASRDVVTVAPNDSMLTALQRILGEQVDHLPVVSDGRVVGMCTRTDVLRARGSTFEHEHFQGGWTPSWLRVKRRT
jgi:CBS domain-containing protein